MTRSLGGRSKAWQPVAPGKRVLRRQTVNATRIWEFTYVPSAQTMVVPARARVLTMECYGAAGEGFSSAAGGLGGYIQATVLVIPGETLYVRVGGSPSILGVTFNGGAQAGAGSLNDGGRGGGGSDVRRGTATSGYEARLIAAGGGGGAGTRYGGAIAGIGGAGGGLVGGDGGDGNQAGGGGKGGTQVAGGDGGVDTGNTGTPPAPLPGTLGEGGRGEGAGLNATGGGGGGGWYGGGGGSANSNASSGGGGGSSGTTGTVVDTQSGVRTGHGFVRISWPF